MTPFEVTYGRKPPSLIAYCVGFSLVEAVDAELRSRDELLQQLRVNLRKSQSAMKLQADKHRKAISFDVGERVLLRLQPYRQLSMGRRSSHKLSLRFYGPFEVLEKVGPVAYRLQLPKEARIHPVFHVSLLRPFFSDKPVTVHPLPPDVTSTTVLHHPLSVIAHRTILHRGRPFQQVLVQWTDLGPENSTWEDPAFVEGLSKHNLEDKVRLDGVGNEAQATTKAAQANPATAQTSPAEEAPINNPSPTEGRPKRRRAQPTYLQDYEL